MASHWPVSVHESVAAWQIDTHSETEVQYTTVDALCAAEVRKPWDTRPLVSSVHAGRNSSVMRTIHNPCHWMRSWHAGAGNEEDPTGQQVEPSGSEVVENGGFGTVLS